ncbi:hypothetical protein EIP86_008843 [Pleurotus ostreatoroseus]|nr:hypothetical protein EIP86_008843 [Pleurotus ostreatoroseus]
MEPTTPPYSPFLPADKVTDDDVLGLILDRSPTPEDPPYTVAQTPYSTGEDEDSFTFPPILRFSPGLTETQPLSPLRTGGHVPESDVDTTPSSLTSLPASSDFSISPASASTLLSGTGPTETCDIAIQEMPAAGSEGDISMSDSSSNKVPESQPAADPQEHSQPHALPQPPQKLALALPNSSPSAVRSNAHRSWRDSLTACKTADEMYLITSPNAPFIPEPVLDRITVMRQWDGYFGKHDPVHWPQVFVNSSRFRWLMAVARKPEDPEDPRLSLWKPLLLTDVVSEPNSYLKTFGKVSPARLAELQPLVASMSARAEQFSRQCGEQPEFQSLVVEMERAFDRLDYPSLPMDLIVQVACVQRCWLLADAWLEFNVHLYHMYHFTDPETRVRNKPRLDLMGAFTNVPNVIQLMFEAGVPVWIYRLPQQVDANDTVMQVVDMRMYDLPDRCHPFPVQAIYEGYAGIHHLTAIASHTQAYLGLHMMFSGAHGVRPLTAGISGAGMPLSQVLPVPRPPTETAPKPSPLSVSTSMALEPSSPSVSTKTTLGPSTSGGPTKTAPNPPRGKVKQTVHGGPRYQPYNAKAAARPARAKHPKVSNPGERSKFDSVEHELLPPNITAWKEALSAVDTSREAPDFNPWFYWLPEAALMVNAKSERAERYIRNWLRARSAWYLLLGRGLLHQGDDLRPLRPQEWREYLNMADWSAKDMRRDTLTASRKRRVFEMFERVFGTDNILEDSTVDLTWSGQPWSPTSAQQTHEIMWEMADLGFRCELVQLDCHLVPNTAADDARIVTERARETLIRDVFCGRPFIPKASSTASAAGLGAANLKDRVGALEALRKVMARWPNAPTIICKSELKASDSEQHLKQMERAICRHYVQAYWEAGGRAATIPRQFPISTSA